MNNPNPAAADVQRVFKWSFYNEGIQDNVRVGHIEAVVSGILTSNGTDFPFLLPNAQDRYTIDVIAARVQIAGQGGRIAASQVRGYNFAGRKPRRRHAGLQPHADPVLFRLLIRSQEPHTAVVRTFLGPVVRTACPKINRPGVHLGTGFKDQGGPVDPTPTDFAVHDQDRSPVFDRQSHACLDMDFAVDQVGVFVTEGRVFGNVVPNRDQGLGHGRPGNEGSQGAQKQNQ